MMTVYFLYVWALVRIMITILEVELLFFELGGFLLLDQKCDQYLVDGYITRERLFSDFFSKLINLLPFFVI